MGVRNRERRAAKQRARKRAGERARGGSGIRDHGFGPWGDLPRLSMELVTATVLAAGQAHADGDASAPIDCAAQLQWGELGSRPGLVDRAVDAAARQAVALAWARGWLPVDLWQVTVRRLGARAASYVLDAIAANAAGYAEVALAGGWRAQLRQLDARAWWQREQPHLSQWALRHGATRTEALALVVEFVALVGALPQLEELLPPPGSAGARGRGRAPAGGLEEKVLARVRALLAKAESTDFAEEAEALSSKAQELMSRYALQRAMLDAGAGGASAAGGRRIWLDNPYLMAKSMLINVVASANRARAVFSEGMGFVTVVGDEVDLDIVEMLSTSLLVQATAAMLAAGRRTGARSQSRTRSYRQSFLVSYATRIGERLTAASAAANSTVAESVGDAALLPVLAARSRAVDELFQTMFPALTSRRVSASSPAGWGAGRAAADLAVLDTHRAVAS